MSKQKNKLDMTSREYKYILNRLPGLDETQTAALVEIADNLRIIAMMLSEHTGVWPYANVEVKKVDPLNEIIEEWSKEE